MLSKDKKQVSKKILKELQGTNQTLIYEIVNKDNGLLYSFEFYGQNISQDLENISLELELTKDNIHNINKLKEKFLYLRFKHSGDLPTKTRVKILVKDYYQDGTILKLYYYNSDSKKTELKMEEVEVRDGFIEIEIDHCSDYLLTTDVLLTSKINVGLIILIILTIVLIIELIIYFTKNKTKKQKDLEITKDLEELTESLKEIDSIIEEPQIIPEPLEPNFDETEIIEV